MAYDLAGAQRILQQEAWFTVDGYKARAENFTVHWLRAVRPASCAEEEP